MLTDLLAAAGDTLRARTILSEFIARNPDSDRVPEARMRLEGLGAGKD